MYSRRIRCIAADGLWASGKALFLVDRSGKDYLPKVNRTALAAHVSENYLRTRREIDV
jgi:hypothetical protein